MGLEIKKNQINHDFNKKNQINHDFLFFFKIVIFINHDLSGRLKQKYCKDLEPTKSRDLRNYSVRTS